MTVNISELAADKTLEVRVSGKLDKEAYDQFVPLIEEKIKKYGKINLLLILDSFHGWDAAALWEDIKFDVHHFSDFERLAIVGESKWEKGMAVFCRPFTTAKIKYFDHADIEAARAWVRDEAE